MQSSLLQTLIFVLAIHQCITNYPKPSSRKQQNLFSYPLTVLRIDCLSRKCLLRVFHAVAMTAGVQEQESQWNQEKFLSSL